MPSLFTINVQNNSNVTQSFYFFQQPALFTGGAQVYSNSLYCQMLPSYPTSGAVLTFQASMQTYACIQQANSYPMVGQISGYASASRAIELANASASTNDGTTASVNPLGLSPATPMQGVPNGSFAVVMPGYSPSSIYNVGSAIQQMSGSVVLSSFVVASPSTNNYCQPSQRFYIQTGNYTAGTVINFTQSSMSAAMCDLSSGRSTFMVTYNMDGTWSVSAH